MRNRLDSYSGLIVGGQRLAIKQVSDSSRSFDTAQCVCGTFLVFSTNNGYVIESCPTCKYSRQMQPARTRSLAELAEYAIDIPEPTIKPRGKCIECSAEVIATGTRAPKRCHACTRTRQLNQQREWSKQRRREGGGIMATIKLSSGDKYFPQDDPETRQHYANVGISRYLAFHAPRRFVPFSEILEQFRRYGKLYDMGFRLRDSVEAAA